MSFLLRENHSLYGERIMRSLLVILLALVLSGGGAAAAALAMTTEQWETQRIASETLAAAVAAVEDARADAVAEHTRLRDLTTEGQELVEAARAFLALEPGWADSSLIESLDSALDDAEVEWAAPLPASIPKGSSSSLAEATRWAATLREMGSEARTMADGRAALLETARDAARELARSAVKGASSLASMALASEDSRDAARTQLAAVADDVRSGSDFLSSLGDYSVAWAALHDAQVAAQAAADAAAAAAAETAVESSGGSSSGFVRAPFTLPGPPDLSNPPSLVLDGAYDPSCFGDVGNEWYYDIADGEVVYLNYPTRYNASLFPPQASFGHWAVHVWLC